VMCSVIGRIGINAGIFIAGLLILIKIVNVAEWGDLLQIQGVIEFSAIIQIILALSIMTVPEGIYEALNNYIH